MAITQAWLLISGNYAWLNFITIILTFSCFDDRALGRVLPIHTAQEAIVGWQDWAVFALTALVLALSWRPARNLVSKKQVMNASFEPLRLVNTYGAFGSVTRERREVVLEGTCDESVTEDTVWREYEFRGKPGDLKRRPPQWAPYHLRLDWLMWFAGLSPAWTGNWFGPLIQKLLENDKATLRLLRHNPFPDRPPRLIRAVYYRYRFTTWRERRETGAWWIRTRVGEYLPPSASGT
jgi:hypothetical protein